MADSTFTLEQTHGMLRRPDASIQLSSDRHGWRSMYASVQRECPFESQYPAVESHLIVLHRSGPLTMHWWIDGVSRCDRVEQNGVFFLPAGQDFGVQLEKPLNSIHLYLRASIVDEILAEMSPAVSRERALRPRLGAPDRTLSQLCLTVAESLHDDPHNTGLFADHMARTIAARLVGQQAMESRPPRAPEPSFRGLDKARLARVIDYIEAHIDTPLELADLAALCDLSVTCFSRQFRLATGLPPYRYVLQRRCERARDLLEQKSLPIAEIAHQCGFCNQEHLTRHFRRHSGVTPGAYRRNL